MNVERSPMSSRRPGGWPNDVDDLLRDFFRAEMPNPWPEIQLPEVDAPAKPLATRGYLSWSRGVLAASVLFLLLGQMALSGRFAENPRVTTDLAPGSLGATNRNRHDKGKAHLAVPDLNSSSKATPASGR